MNRSMSLPVTCGALVGTVFFVRFPGSRGRRIMRDFVVECL